MRLRGSVSKEPKRTIFLREVLLPKMGHGVEGAGAAASRAADASGCGFRLRQSGHGRPPNRGTSTLSAGGRVAAGSGVARVVV